MRRAGLALLLVCAAATAGAQQPGFIKKPIDAAKKAAGAASAAVENAQKTGEGKTVTQQPAASAMKAAPNAAKGAARGVAAAPMNKADSAKAAAARDSASRRGSASQSGGKGTVTFYREEFGYDAANRRDPFLSLMLTGELRPLLADLALIGVMYDGASPNRSVAVLEDGTNKDTYRVKVGQVLGRMKVMKIGQQDITFTIDEFGFSRQETLPMDMSRKAGGQPGRRPQ